MGAYRPRSSQNASLSQSAKETQMQRTTLRIVVALPLDFLHTTSLSLSHARPDLIQVSPIEALFNHTHYYHPSI
ncbi:BZ3500_MvSof-1268-A1-R1_Chr1-3g01754 [Microbotryum saponariae]|uniref:BZ3500_MvSof-1268-A1-R1_Chr1-3g01754 protein n=1 Tax=Microbotryum saponariae TaxID=289078 RepID=A0A2X0MDX9_9BASI|nr:BZ3500_MvSof-1268-A1-R1_Chr1-3g01754 [Microbotryum saponariae]SCZ94536.1 BZ3501_MvSof-1269-A2-R1_Chr1-3g01356 [Microbotryum saponariae]